MRQAQAEEIADAILADTDRRDLPASMRLTPREAIVKHLLAVVECNGCPSITEALNSGDGSYKP